MIAFDAYSVSTCFFFFFNDTATTEIYTLSLHDALPIWRTERTVRTRSRLGLTPTSRSTRRRTRDRKSTRLNSSHTVISYAVFCLKKKKKKKINNNNKSQTTLKPITNNKDEMHHVTK